MDFAVVTTIYNDRNEIEDLLSNIAMQTYPPSQIVIADGGSNEETISFVNKIIKEYNIPINYLTGKCLNIAEGFNEAINSTNFEFIAIVAVGNKYPENYFEILVNTLEKEKFDYVYPPFKGQDNNKFSKVYNQVMLGNNRGNYLPIASNHGVLIKKRVFVEMGFFYENFVYAGEDEEFYKKISNNGYKGRLIEKTMVEWDTPRSWKAYKRQVKVYTIARMQIYNFIEIVNKDKKKFIYAIGLLSAICLLIIFKFNLMGLGLMIIFICINLFKCIQKGILFTAIKNASFLLPIYYYSTQCKYFRKKYHVNDMHRRKV